MTYNENVDLDFYDGSLQVSIDSEEGAYVRRVLRDMINRCSVVVCLIGNGTAWREWVDWELRTALSLGKGICGVRLKGSRGRAPSFLGEIAAPIAGWSVPDMIAAIECAAARRS